MQKENFHRGPRATGKMAWQPYGRGPARGGRRADAQPRPTWVIDGAEVKRKLCVHPEAKSVQVQRAADGSLRGYRRSSG